MAAKFRVGLLGQMESSRTVRRLILFQQLLYVAHSFNCTVKEAVKIVVGGP